MIRINLLPVKRQAQQTEGSPIWLAVVAGILLFQAVGLAVFHQFKLKDLERQLATNQEIQTQISEIQKTVADHANVKAQLAVYRQREEAIHRLQSARTGPTAVLLEISQVLSPGRGPTMDADKAIQLRKDNPQAMYNPTWDPQRLWLLQYKEADRVVTIEGLARDGEDVSEFAKRLALSTYFESVKLLPATKIKETESKVEMLKFQLQAKVKY